MGEKGHSFTYVSCKEERELEGGGKKRMRQLFTFCPRRKRSLTLGYSTLSEHEGKNESEGARKKENGWGGSNITAPFPRNNKSVPPPSTRRRGRPGKKNGKEKVRNTNASAEEKGGTVHRHSGGEKLPEGGRKKRAQTRVFLGAGGEEKKEGGEKSAKTSTFFPACR